MTVAAAAYIASLRVPIDVVLGRGVGLCHVVSGLGVALCHVVSSRYVTIVLLQM